MFFWKVKTKLATYIGKKITEKGFNHSLLFTLEEIRTPDLLVRSQTLYPTELRAHILHNTYHT